MKKLLALLLIIIPLNLLAYSNTIIPGGETIGIEIKTKGLVVVGFYKVNDKYIGGETLKTGDIITKIDGKEVNSIDDLTNIIDTNEIIDKINITIKRNNKEIDTYLRLLKEDNTYKTGLYIKDKVYGVGTLTYVDPETKIYGSLGHQVLMSESTSALEVKEGNICEANVEGIDRSENGLVGNKNARIDTNNAVGTINKNSTLGLYGKFNNPLDNKEALQIKKFDEINLGRAYIYTELEENNIKKYEIEIVSINKKDIKTNRSITFIIKDEELLNKAGGIVQGMSGSPIIQDNKIIGAVTHVVVDNVEKGYAIYIETMLEEGEND